MMQRLSWLFGVVGLAAAAVGWWVAPREFYGAWLAAFIALAAWPLGSLGLLLAHTMTGGRWGEAVRPALQGGVMLMPLLIPAAIPLLFGLSTLYVWLAPQIADSLPNRFYLNGPFFAVRSVIYAVVWLGLSFFAIRAFRRPETRRTLARLAPPGAILLALTVTFFSIDVSQSLEPGFNSSVYGLLTLADMTLFAFAGALAATCLAGEPEARLLPVLARILLGLTILWAYLEFVQALIVWESDLTVEVPWYLHRTTGAWGMVAWTIAGGHFLLPFLLLLSPRHQADARSIGVIALVLMAMEVTRWWWIVLPSLSLPFGWIDAAAMIGLGGVGSGVYLAVRHG
jgi:hypothetical protein